MKTTLSTTILSFVLLFTIGCAPSLFSRHPDDPVLRQGITGLEASHNSAEAANDLAWAVYLYDNNAERAQALWTEALRHDPMLADAYGGLMLSLMYQGKLPQCLQTASTLLQKRPDSPQAEFAAGILMDFQSYDPTVPQWLWPRLETWINQAGFSAPVRENLTALWIASLYERGMVEKAQAAEKDQGRLERWIIAGPFGENGLVDFDTAYPPQRGAVQPVYGFDKLTKVMEINRAEQDFSVQDLSELGGVYYATTYLTMKQSGRYLLRLSTARLSDVYVNDALVYRKDTRTKRYPLVQYLPVSLKAGPNKLQIKLGVRRGYGTFGAYLTQTDGRPVRFTQTGRLDIQPTTPTAWGGQEHPLEGAYGFWAQRMDDKGGDQRAMLWASLHAQLMGYDDEALDAIEKALHINPAGAILYARRAKVYETSSLFSKQVGQDLAENDWLQATKLAPDMTTIVMKTLIRDLREDRPRDALAKLERAGVLLPESSFVYYHLFNVYKGLNATKEALENLDRALSLNSRDASLLKAARSYYASLGMQSKVRQVEDKLARVAWRSRVIAKRLVREGKLEEATKAYRDLVAISPRKTGLKMDLVQVLIARHRYEEAYEMLSDLRQLPGYEDRFVMSITDLLMLQGDEHGARMLLDWLLKTHPHLNNLRERRAFRSGNRPLDELALSGDLVMDRFKQAAWKPDAGEVLVLDEYIQRIFPDGSSQARTHIIMRPQTKDALSRHAEVFIPGGAQVLRLRGVTADGKELVPEEISGKEGYTLHGMSVGDFVEYDYLTFQRRDTLFRQPAFGSSFRFTNFNVPVFVSRFVVIVPESLAVDFVAQAMDGLKPAEVTHKNGLVTMIYSNRTLDEWRAEPLMPPAVQVLPKVTLQGRITWKSFARARLQDSLGQNLDCLALRRFLDEHDQPQASLSTRVRALYAALRDEIKGKSSNGAFHKNACRILSDKDGNRLLVLKALLDKLGVENRFVLARPATYPSERPTYFDMTFYTDIFLEVRMMENARQQRWYLDATNDAMPFGAFPPVFQGGQAMAFSLEDEPFTLPTGGLEATEGSDFRFEIQPDGSSSISGMEWIKGYDAANLRTVLKRIPQQQRKPLFEAALGRHLRGAELSEYRVENTEQAEKPLVLHYEGRTRYLLHQNPQTGALRLEKMLYPLELGRKFIGVPERTLPLLINRPQHSELSLRFTLPDGWGIDGKLPAATMKSPFGTYTLESRMEGKQLILTRHFHLAVQRIEPQAYADFVRFCHQVDSFEQQGFVVRSMTTANQDDEPHSNQTMITMKSESGHVHP